MVKRDIENKIIKNFKTNIHFLSASNKNDLYRIVDLNNPSSWVRILIESVSKVMEDELLEIDKKTLELQNGKEDKIELDID